MILHIGKADTYNKELVLKNYCFSCLNTKEQIKTTVAKIINKKSKFICNKKLLNTFELKNVVLEFIKNSKKILNDK